MGAGHSHSHGAGGNFKTPQGVQRLVLIALAPLIVLTVIGMAATWPDRDQLPVVEVGDFVRGTVEAVEPCTGGEETCAIAVVMVDEGPDAGSTVDLSITIGANSPALEPGTQVYLHPQPEGTDPAYSLADVDRTLPLALLALLFAVAVIVLARWKGVSALVGLAAALGILAYYVLPALLEGRNPVMVAAIGASAIAIVSMGLAHGFNVRTGVALVGTILALILTTLLGGAFTAAMNFTGVATDDAAYLFAVSGGVLDLRGLLLAGLVIGALGVLDDVTVTQAATVWEVYGANERVTFRNLWAAGMRVGRDHVAAVVNTLVLAYAGAALPLFMLISLSDAPLLQSINSETIAAEILRSMVGGLGIIAAVPITTGLAALLLVDSRRRAVAASRFVRP